MLDLLPIELLSAIAEIHPVTCLRMWMYNEQFAKHFAENTASFVPLFHRGNKLLGLLHSLNDKPVCHNDRLQWYHLGQLHRDGDLPAYIVLGDMPLEIAEEIGATGIMPALDQYTGWEIAWYNRGQYHRDGDKPALIIRFARESHWYQHGRLHRAVGPAVTIANYGKKWLVYGVLHRDDGPAKIIAGQPDEWHLYGVRYYPGFLRRWEDKHTSLWWESFYVVDRI